MKEYIRGVKAAIPIALGYLSVSFSFGIIAVGFGLSWWQAMIISMLNVTSAGQLAGVQIMSAVNQYFAMFFSQLTINMRYSFMSISLSQKTDSKFTGIYRWLLGFFMTDEIFGVASKEKEVSKEFFFGMGCISWLGWVLGTVTGGILGNVLPEAVLSALGIALYAMFIAIVVPDAIDNKAVLAVSIIAMILSCCFKFLPYINRISGGVAISLCAIIASVIAAAFFPVKEEEEGAA